MSKLLKPHPVPPSPTPPPGEYTSRSRHAGKLERERSLAPSNGLWWVKKPHLVVVTSNVIDFFCFIPSPPPLLHRRSLHGLAGGAPAGGWKPALHTSANATIEARKQKFQKLATQAIERCEVLKKKMAEIESIPAPPLDDPLDDGGKVVSLGLAKPERSWAVVTAAAVVGLELSSGLAL